MKAPILKMIKDVIGRAAGKAGILARDFRSQVSIVAFHRINETLPEGGLTYSSAISERPRALVRKAGFVWCAGCLEGVNPSTGHAFDLNRISVGQGFLTPDQFALDLFLNRI